MPVTTGIPNTILKASWRDGSTVHRGTERHFGGPPLLLLDDIFGELDPERRNALLAALPSNAQRIISTTHLDWMEGEQYRVLRL